jgi:nucleotide-binding universal stress UspA family protein
MDIQTLFDPANLQKVLVCTDESPDSQGALTAVLTLARSSGCQVYLLEVLEFFPDYEFQREMIIPSPMPLDLLRLREEAVQGRLEAWQAEAAKQGVALEIRVRSSSAIYAGILEEIEDLKPQLLIMGRRGHTGLERLMMGSVAARVIGHSPVSVLVVPREVTLDFKRLLIASDGSTYSAAAWEQALLLARRLGSTLIIASVARNDAEIDTAREIVARLEKAAADQGMALDPLVLQGRPYEAIVKAAHQKQADLIILGSHGRTGLKRLLMGSVAERVIGQAPCAVLVVKGGGGA